ncbi:NADPH oxidase 3 [Eumeta japonica]|uniref:NADPH oxidase 3 n=1 Tax=Eumeta variegata TaxID=151549 RepID=A0A4C1YNB6_EUMVA|nr:NADPH oxidase 3 [Eumeta japonica]
MPGRIMKFTLECLTEHFVCKPGQYVLLQCCQISMMEWHPFTVVEVSKSSQNKFSVWIRTKGDWTEALEKLFKGKAVHDVKDVILLVDGPFSSPMQGVVKSRIAICVAAGVGITPFVSAISSMLKKSNMNKEEKVNLLTPILAVKRLGAIRKQESRTREKNIAEDKNLFVDEKYELAKEFPLLACRLKKGRPHWDKIFGYWIHLYPSIFLPEWEFNAKKARIGRTSDDEHFHQCGEDIWVRQFLSPVFFVRTSVVNNPVLLDARATR